jgi:hypothetical protein
VVIGATAHNAEEALDANAGFEACQLPTDDYGADITRKSAMLPEIAHS